MAWAVPGNHPSPTTPHRKLTALTVLGFRCPCSRYKVRVTRTGPAIV